MVFVFLPNEVQMRNASFWLSTLYKCKHLEPLKQIHSSLIITGLIHDLFVAGKLLLHSTFSLHHASLILQHSPSPDVFMYNTLIRAFSESNHPQKALALYAHMRTKLLSFPDSFSFAFALKAAASFASYEAGIQLHCQAFVCGFCHHLFVGTTLVSMYGECGFFKCSQKVFDEMPERNVVAWNAVVNACFRSGDLSLARMLFDSMPCRDLTSWNVALMGYVKGGQLERAMGIFREMPVKDNVSWSTLIVGFAHNGCFDEAFGCFRELIREGARLSEVSLSAVLSACAQSGAFEFGKILHGFIEKAGFAHVLSVNNALLDTYAKCGHVRMAQLVFWGISEKKSIVSWTSMMAGLAMHGHGEEAIKLFHEMEDSGIRPDGIAFISLLYACSHAGLVKQGCSYFDRMRKMYCLEPEIEHYGCMVDLYGRSGQLQKAYEFVCQMPIPPNAIIWRTLLGACSIHSNVKLAEIVKERLSLLDPNNSGDHVLLSNVYAVAGKWTDFADVRRTMTDNRVKKTPGWSIIEVDKIIYTFVAGANVDKITEEAYEKLKEIMCRLRIEGGYIPEVRNVLYDIDEEEKEDSVTRHSEKLAVAFGIARLRKRKTITIVKNLRICRDCHAVLKLISKVYKLEIVVRDRSRFHSFTLGFCSCRDYW